MASTRVGCTLPKNTNVTRGEDRVLKVGPYKTDGTVAPSDIVSLGNDGLTLAQTGAATKPLGVLEYDTTVNWGTTTPARGTSYPSGIYVHVIVKGPCIVATAAASIADNTVAGDNLCAVGSGAAGNVNSGDYIIGTVLDEEVDHDTDGYAEIDVNVGSTVIA